MAAHSLKTSCATVALGAGLMLASQPVNAQIVSDDGPAPDASLSTGQYGAGNSGNQGDARDGRRGGHQSRSPSRRIVQVEPYIEVGQVLAADLSPGGDTLTYSTIAVGVDANVATRRAQAAISARYERRFGWDSHLANNDVISGLARARYELSPGFSLEGGALATRASIDGRRGSANLAVGDRSNTANLYSFYVGPTFGRRVGDVDVAAGYRFGYSRSDFTQGSSALVNGVRVGSFDDSRNHVAFASVGMNPGRLPVGWRLSGGWERDEAGQLDQRFESLNGRFDVTLPVSPTVALVAGVGYEDIKVSNRAPLRDVNGVPVVDGNGRLVSDYGQPRQIAFDTSGLIYDAGVLWRPSRRMSLEARVGRRYDDWSYTGSWSLQATNNTAYQVAVYDSLSTVGRQLSAGLAALPTDFQVFRNPIDGGIGDCAFGAGGGTCLTPTLGNLSGFAFRNRGIAFSMSSRMRPWTFGVGAGYDRRTYVANGASFAGLNGSADETYYVYLSASRPISERTSFGASAYSQWFSSGLGGPDAVSAGASAALAHVFVPHLTGNAAVSFNTIGQDGFNTRYFASALLGLRYGF